MQTSNQIRDTLRAELQFPLLLWLDDRTLTRFMEIAHDLYSWATSKRFIANLNTIHSYLKMQGEQFFTRIFQADDIHLLGVKPLFSEKERKTIYEAIDELKLQEQTLPQNLQATFDFVKGRNAYRQNKWEKALEFYEQSLELRQNSLFS